MRRLYHVESHVATIALNRPDKLNAMTAKMTAALREAMRTREGRVVSRGKAVTVMRDPQTGASRPLTEAERASALALRGSQ